VAARRAHNPKVAGSTPASATFRLSVVAFALVASGCFTRTIAERMGVSGWFRADRPSDSYKGRFEKFQVDGACPAVRDDTSKPIVVLVHGVGGDGPEMEQVLPPLAEWQPPAIFMLRWVPWDDRDLVRDRLAAGISRIADCAREHRVLVIAHSAGGVITSHAASKIVVSDRAPVELWTVASPLAGTVRRAGNPDGKAEATLMLDLGSRITQYPEAAPGVTVKHLRTQAPADHIMEPSGDLMPNDPKIGVPGAPQYDLPAQLTHEGALVYVVQQLTSGADAPWR
jgi:hypothetical protein